MSDSRLKRFLLAFLALQLSALSLTVSAQDDEDGYGDGIFPSRINPKSRLLTVFEFLDYLDTEAGVEFEAADEFAAKLNLTMEELGERADAVWQDSSMFEFARAVRDGRDSGTVYPFLVCDDLVPEEGRDNGFTRKSRIEAAIKDAATSTNITINEEKSLAPVYNGPQSWCGFANLNGVLAENIEGMVVQPFVFSMKMSVSTIETLIEGLEKFYNETEFENPGTRKMQEEEKLHVFPSATITLCESIMSEEDYEKNLEDESKRDWTEEMTEWLLARTNLGDSVSFVTTNVYWTNPKAKSLRKTDTERAVFWEEVFKLAFEGDECVDTFENRLKWTVLLGDTYDAPQALLLEFIDTNAEAIDEYCIIGLLAAVTAKHTVCQLEITPEKSISNANARWMVQTGVENQTPWFDVGLDGTGQVVAVSDTGIDVMNCYFEDSIAGQPTAVETDIHRKIVQYDPYINDRDYVNGHGTHVAGTIAGKRMDAPGAADGVAPGAKLAFVDIGYDNGSLQLPSDSVLLATGRGGLSSAKAHIHSASWGSVGVNGYSYQSRSFDNYMYDNDDFLIIVAAGNDGRYDALNTVSAPATAKNIISVGASHSFGYDLAKGMLGPAYVADFSSRGPTRDGRMKPDVVAPGKYIVSAAARPDQPGACDEGIPGAGDSRGGLVSMAGTSMATPVTSGTAALVRQYFEEGWYEDGTKNSGESVSPSGALVKAVLMNGAQTNMKGVDNGSMGMGSHITGVSPYDEAIGFGRIYLTSSLYIKGKTDVQVKFWDRQTVTHDGLRRYGPVTIDKSNGCLFDQLSVTLVWVEPGSAANCVRCLLNDLDLYVTKDGDESTRYLPNGGRRDDTNNAERVIIENVNDGDSFTLHVDPYNLDSASQQFALVATGCFGGIANEIDTSKNVFTTDGSKDTRTRNIIIIVCSVVGGLIVICGLSAFLKKRRQSKY